MDTHAELLERVEALARAARGRPLAPLFTDDPGRLARFVLEAAGIRVDFARQPVSGAELDALLGLARSAGIASRRDAMLRGERVNLTEDRAALHTALRRNPGEALVVDGADLMPAVDAELHRMEAFSDAVRAGRWRGATGRPIADVVSIGIGGSSLGPQLVCEALREQAHRRLRLHFLSNVDPGAWAALHPQLDPASTLFVIASKSWRTAETARNAEAARDWLLARGVAAGQLASHLVGITANPAGARVFGLHDEAIFGFEDWVGGRFSVWSAIGLPVMLSIGHEGFRRLLTGARAMDRHFAEAPLERNAPVLLALLSWWNRLVLDGGSEAVVPYCDALRRLPAWLQQLQMESNGKSVDVDGRPVRGPTAAVTWGEPGTDAQHSFFQALHQGASVHPVEFVLAVPAQPDPQGRDLALLASAIAQAEALMHGRNLAEALASLHAQGLDEAQAARLAPHLVHPGNRPSTTLLLDRLDPERLGALLALYEHRTAVLGWLWNVNSFDQWGVELGKQLARNSEALLRGDGPLPPGLDPASAALIERLRGVLSGRG
ncbi:glucose-6-phosphate isomerase [Quisquiliibacterium transsilvanicum]|uniref:Glucose-6-phosphate isomerase n=1 Tax=Quisquiliibacterium transsilvanicum TaxID=1549638 RepID=A0A7W8HE10_9BURK|nr:glucose-6-phosphate isomerase [Quisquiliibacterium transsilvanicum]MBB5270334.1 glucose-6-phosphate isomerase [Quisquiliibacterium transsilvanicum]